MGKEGEMGSRKGEGGVAGGGGGAVSSNQDDIVFTVTLRKRGADAWPN